MTQSSTSRDQPPAPATASRNGPATLSDRVRSLRLSDQITAGGGGRSAKLPWVLCAFLGLSTLYLGYLISSTPAPPERKSESGPQAAAPLKTGPKGAAGSVVFEAKGYVIPASPRQVTPEVAGRILELYVVEGKKVQAGEVLCRLDKEEFQADHDKAVAALKAANHRLANLVKTLPEDIRQAAQRLKAAEARTKQTEDQESRAQTLTKQRASSTEDTRKLTYDLEACSAAEMEARSSLDRATLSAPEQLDAARAEVRQAEADLVKARRRLKECDVRAPVTGIILNKKTEIGNIVNPAAFNVSALVCEMADLSDLEVELTIQERDIAKIFTGQKCRIRPDAAPDRTYYGAVSRLMPFADRSKGTIAVRVRVEVPGDEQGVYLRPDGAALVSFLRAEKEQPPTAKSKKK